MSKVLTLVGVPVLALALLLGMAAPALAAPQETSRSDLLEGEFLTGEVLSIGDQEFVIQSGEEELTIAVAEDTVYYQVSAPARLMALARQRLQIRQQYQLELQTQAENGQCQGQGLKSRLRAAVSVRNQLRVQNQLSQVEETLPAEVLYCRWLRNFGEEAAFADISVGDNVAVWLAEGDNLALAVLIIEPAD